MNKLFNPLNEQIEVVRIKKTPVSEELLKETANNIVFNNNNNNIKVLNNNIKFVSNK